MPRSKFETIYKDIKNNIENQTYQYQDLLPSENTMVNIYNSSRNTIRRAIAILVEEGYVQSLQGKGVRVIYQPVKQTPFKVGGIESFKETAKRNHKQAATKVIQFAEIICDERISTKSGFPIGTELYYIQRVRYLDNKALILDINLFLKSEAPELTPQICEESIYEYLENSLDMQIVTSKRTITVERATEIDEKYLELKDYGCLAVVSGQTFNAAGIMFEYTQSRHHPDYFCFQDTAVRRH